MTTRGDFGTGVDENGADGIVESYAVPEATDVADVSGPMTSLPLLVALLAAAPPAGDVAEIPAALLRFTPGPGFVAAQVPEPPAVWSGVLRIADQSVARLDVFVLPVAADASAAELEKAAIGVARFFLPEFIDLDRPAAPDARVLLDLTGEHDTTAARLVAAAEQDRRIALLLVGRRDVILDRADEFVATALSVTAIDTPWSTDPGAQVVDAPRGFGLTVPAKFESGASDDGLPLLRGFETPPHFGLGATFEIDAERVDLDLPLADAAANAFGAGAALHAVDVGPFHAIAAAAADRDAQHRTIEWLVDLPRRRIRIVASAPKNRFAAFESAFTAAVLRLRSVEPRPENALGDRFTDSEHGYSIRPPVRLVREPHSANDPDFAGALAVFVDRETKSPSNALVVRTTSCENGDALAAANRTAADAGAHGFAVVAAPDRRLLNRRPASRFTLGRGDEVEYRTIVATDAGGFELTFSCAASELAILRSGFDASALTFQTLTRAVAPELGEPLATGRIRFRAPKGWRSIGASTFAPAEDDGTRVEFGVAHAPAKGQLGGAAESYRAAFVAELEAAGNTSVRVEESRVEEKRGRTTFWYRVAFVAQGRPVRELRLALPSVDGADGIAFARAVSPAARFAELLDLFDATIWSLDWNDAGN